MKKSDIGVVVVMYAICLLFFTMTRQLKATAQIYPLCLIGALFLLNTLHLLRCVISLRKEGFINDFPEIFKDFMARQFFVVIAASIGYMILMYVAGFYLSSIIYLVGVQWFLGVPKIPLCITVVSMAVLIYAVFSLFLKVPLPVGMLLH